MTRFAWLCLAAVSVVVPAEADDATIQTTTDDAVGVVKLNPADDLVVRGQCADQCCDADECCNDGCCESDTCCNGNGCNGSCGDECKCGNGKCKNCRGSRMGHALAKCRAKKQLEKEMFKQYLRSKFGYFCPTGNCGKGVPLWGHYKMVYAQNPSYTDSRDGYQYAAPGYGTPVNVPLAPNVRHSYNYGWGIPSSRLTPMRQATVVGPPQPAVLHGAHWHK